MWGSIAQFEERYPQLGRLSWATAHFFCLSALTILRLMCTTAVQSLYASNTRCLKNGLFFILSNQCLTRMNSSGSSSKRGHSTFVMLRDHAGLGWSQKWLQIYIYMCIVCDYLHMQIYSIHNTYIYSINTTVSP